MSRFASSALVVAHPDDEVPWFSSVVGKVERVIICYEECAELPELADGRRAARQAYPLATATWLRRAEPCSLRRVDWRSPIRTAHGMALDAPGAGEADRARYVASDDLLRADLRAALAAGPRGVVPGRHERPAHRGHRRAARLRQDDRVAAAARAALEGREAAVALRAARATEARSAGSRGRPPATRGRSCSTP